MLSPPIIVKARFGDLDSVVEFTSKQFVYTCSSVRDHIIPKRLKCIVIQLLSRI